MFEPWNDMVASSTAMIFFTFMTLNYCIVCSGEDLGGGSRGCETLPPEMTCSFLIQLVFCKKALCGLLEETSAPPPKKIPGSAPDVAPSVHRIRFYSS